jgi:hypothetical protein
MEPDGVQDFRFATPAGPSRVWATLTRSHSPYLHWLDLTSTWELNAPIHVHSPGAFGLCGRVQFVAEPGRMTYSIEDPSGAMVYLTWTIRPVDTGSIVHLVVDDPDGNADADECEAVWLPILDRLQSELRRAEASPGCDE